MIETIDAALAKLEAEGNLRSIPSDGTASGSVDFTSNDYLGIAARADLQEEFFASAEPSALHMSASASRLLARRQKAFTAFEKDLSEAYGGRAALIFNSGYHANTGLVSALSAKGTVILADKLVHASIIDGIRLGGAPFERFRHNDIAHLSRLAQKAVAERLRPLIIAESIYSMDGDRADIDGLAEVKRSCPGAMLYIDEAHAVGVAGDAGRGLCFSSQSFADIDIIIGTLGKALASTGAFAIMNGNVRRYAVNRARSLIFSTALPPICVEWSRFIFGKALGMDSERKHLTGISQRMATILSGYGVHAEPSHILPYLVGNPRKAVELSARFAEEGIDVLPIRTPTVPPGTDRLRLSLSAAMTDKDIDRFENACKKILTHAQ